MGLMNESNHFTTNYFDEIASVILNEARFPVESLGDTAGNILGVVIGNAMRDITTHALDAMDSALEVSTDYRR